MAILYYVCLVIAIIILFVMMFITTDHLNSRLVRNEEYLKVVSEDLKQIKILLKAEVAMANSDAYPGCKDHMSYITFDESEQQK